MTQNSLDRGQQISLRCHVENDIQPTFQKYNSHPNYNNSTVLVFDSHTTNDQYQNLVIGTCGIWVNEKLQKFCLFHDASNILGVSEDSDCTVYENLEEKILEIRPRDSHKFGISRSNLVSLQKKIRNKTNRVLNLQKKTIEKIISGSIMASGGEFIR
ncbi:MAG: hypothetical protein OER82_03820 [Nitrosopumilus sp.]|nr:hypothetical protein [Nitrosopumilus sp.]